MASTQDPRQGSDSLEYLRIIWRNKLFILGAVTVSVMVIALHSMTIKDVYRAHAVIMPAQAREGGQMSTLLAQQLGGLASFAQGGANSESELLNLLKSNVLREKMIEKHKLMPVLFPEKWDKAKKSWKQTNGFASRLMSLGKPADEKPHSGPALWDGLRALNSIVSVNKNMREGSITVAVEFHDPQTAAKLVEYMLSSLTQHMSDEAQRVADINRRYLEAQLGRTADPFIKQKIYNMIAQQIETAMMAEIKENFAYKIIDPPRAPDRKIRPNRFPKVVFGFIVSFSASIVLVFFWEKIIRQRNPLD